MSFLPFHVPAKCFCFLPRYEFTLYFFRLWGRYDGTLRKGEPGAGELLPAIRFNYKVYSGKLHVVAPPKERTPHLGLPTLPTFLPTFLLTRSVGLSLRSLLEGQRTFFLFLTPVRLFLPDPPFSRQVQTSMHVLEDDSSPQRDKLQEKSGKRPLDTSSDIDPSVPDVKRVRKETDENPDPSKVCYDFFIFHFSLLE